MQSIVEWATPKSCTEVRRFMGLANYYCRFVEGYAAIADGAGQPYGAIRVDARGTGEL